MTPDRRYPDEPATGFPEPPLALMDGAVTIERCPSADAPCLDELVEMYATFDPADRAQGIPPIGREKVRTWLDTVLDHGVDVVARNDAGALGHATLVPDGDLEYELAIFVHQDHRRLGIGSGLLRALLGAAAADGIEYVWLSVERWNTVAVGLYESVGFRTCDSGSFELEMALRIAP